MAVKMARNGQLKGKANLDDEGKDDDDDKNSHLQEEGKVGQRQPSPYAARAASAHCNAMHSTGLQKSFDVLQS